jgi:hypothetical protein
MSNLSVTLVIKIWSFDERVAENQHQFSGQVKQRKDKKKVSVTKKHVGPTMTWGQDRGEEKEGHETIGRQGLP